MTGGACFNSSQAFSTLNRLVGYTYDAAGNLTNDGTHTYTYDGENRITKVDGGSTASYEYDAFGRRVKRVTPGYSAEYIYDNDGNLDTVFGNGHLEREFVRFAGRVLAEYSGNSVFFVHNDSLGSTRLQTSFPTAAITAGGPFKPGFGLSAEIVHTYSDTISGSKETRPALARLMKDAKARKFDAVVVWKLDRFGRSLRHLVNALAELEALGIGFVSLQNSLDFTTPGGKLQFHVLAAVAEFERELIRERVKAGMKLAMRQGVYCGRPRTKVDGARVRRLRAGGASWSKVARELRVSRTVCQRAV